MNMSMKKKIIGSEYADENLENSVCSHLQPILDLLKENGAILTNGMRLYTDKGGAHTLKLKSKINFNLLRSEFELPNFVELSEEYKSIICRRCWCDIEGA